MLANGGFLFQDHQFEARVPSQQFTAGGKADDASAHDCDVVRHSADIFSRSKQAR